MRTTIDIPDELLKAAKHKALEEDTTLRQLILESLTRALKGDAARKPADHFELPLIHSVRKDTLVLDNETIYDLIDFP